MLLICSDFSGFNVVRWEGAILMLTLQDDSHGLTLDW